MTKKQTLQSKTIIPVKFIKLPNKQEKKTPYVQPEKIIQTSTQKNKQQQILEKLIQRKSIQYKCEYLSFLASIDQNHGLVFNQKIRKQINKKYIYFTKKLQYNTKQGPSQQLVTEKHQWQKQSQQKKIQQMFQKNKNQLQKNIYKNKIDQFKQHITNFFIEISSIFAEQVTHELYDILFDQIKIILDNGLKQENNRKKCLDNLETKLDKIKKYFYFGYYFSIPNILNKDNNQKQPKYAHKQQLSKYQLDQGISRQKDGPFANFIQKSGQVLFEVMYELNKEYQFISNTQLLPTFHPIHKQE